MWPGLRPVACCLWSVVYDTESSSDELSECEKFPRREQFLRFRTCKDKPPVKQTQHFTEYHAALLGVVETGRERGWSNAHNISDTIQRSRETIKMLVHVA